MESPVGGLESPVDWTALVGLPNFVCIKHAWIVSCGWSSRIVGKGHQFLSSSVSSFHMFFASPCCGEPGGILCSKKALMSYVREVKATGVLSLLTWWRKRCQLVSHKLLEQSLIFQIPPEVRCFRQVCFWGPSTSKPKVFGSLGNNYN